MFAIVTQLETVDCD